MPLAIAETDTEGLVVPHQFYGDVIINNEPAPNNLQLHARVGDALYGSTLTRDGTYGYNPNIFYVEYQGRDGERITFFIEGEEVATAFFQSGQSTRLDINAEIEGITTTTGTTTTGGGGGGGGAIPATTTEDEDDTSAEQTNIVGTDSDECEPNWICSEWTECVNNVKRRACLDVNECDDDTDKPAIRESCGQTPEEILGIEEEEEGRNNPFTGLVTGIGQGEVSSIGFYALILALIGTLLFFAYKKRKTKK